MIEIYDLEVDPYNMFINLHYTQMEVLLFITREQCQFKDLEKLRLEKQSLRRSKSFNWSK